MKKHLIALLVCFFFLFACKTTVYAGDLEGPGSLTLTVTNCAATGVGSYPWAVTSIEASSGYTYHTINFNIPNTDSGYTTEEGVSWWRISLTSNPATITKNNVQIIGSSQATNPGDTNPNGPEIELLSTGLNAGIGITGSGAVIDRLAINGFETGISITGDTSTIIGCFVGLSPTGITSIEGTETGISITGNSSIIGTSTVESSGNRVVTTSTALNIIGNSNSIKGNYFGTDRTGTQLLGSGSVVLDDSSSANIIGGTTNECNVIVGADGHGLNLGGSLNQIIGNYIGIGVDASTAMPNSSFGIYFSGPNGTNNVIGPNNIIANNGMQGINIGGTGNKYNTITQNKIYNHPEANIFLHSEANESIDEPIISTYTYNASTQTASLTGSAEADATVEAYVSDNATTQECSTYLGMVLVDSSGDWSASFSMSSADPITALQTDTSGNSSELCYPAIQSSTTTTTTIAPTTTQPGTTTTTTTTTSTNTSTTTSTSTTTISLLPNTIKTAVRYSSGGRTFNPTNNETVSIIYNLDNPSDAVIYVFDSNGRLLFQQVAQGVTGDNTVIFNGVSSFGSILPNGFYLYKIKTNSGLLSGSFTVLK